MFAHTYQVTETVFIGNSAGGIGNDKLAYTEQLKNADRVGGLPHFVSLVVVEASVHGKHFFAAVISVDELTLLVRYRRYGEIGDLAVGNNDLVFKVVGKIAESAAKNNGNVGCTRDLILYKICAFDV